MAMTMYSSSTVAPHEVNRIVGRFGNLALSRITTMPTGADCLSEHFVTGPATLNVVAKQSTCLNQWLGFCLVLSSGYVHCTEICFVRPNDGSAAQINDN